MATAVAAPVLSVVLPLEDARWELEQNLTTWTRGQSLARDRFEVIVVAEGEGSESERIARPLLGPADRVARSSAQSPIESWNTGAREARAEWLFFTEAHCLGDPACLEAVARRVERAGADLQAVTVEHGHVARTKQQRLAVDWFDDIYERWRAPGAWTRLNLVGFAIRRDAFLAAGRLDARFGLFAAPLLSARLAEGHGRIEHATDALVLHKQDEFHEHSEFTEEEVRGELDAREELDPRFAARYFGHSEMWSNKLLYAPAVARPLAASLALATARAVALRHPDARWLARELAPLVPRALAGTGPRRLVEWLRFRSGEELVVRLPESITRRRGGYVSALERVVDLTKVRWVEERNGALAPPAFREGRRDALALDPETLVNAYAVERAGGQWMRWTRPAALVRIAPPAGETALEIETGTVAGPPLERVRAVYAGGHRLPRTALRGRADGLRIALPGSRREAVARRGVLVLTRPVARSALAPGDERRLGLPVRAITIDLQETS